MALPMDNIFFRYFLRYWPVIIAIIITVLLIYQWTRPKVNAEKLQKGIIRQSVLIAVGENPDIGDDIEQQEWLETRQRVEKYFTNSSILNQSPKQQIRYQSYITISLIWTLFWIGVETFLIIRIILNPYYYVNEAIFLGCFTYYIIIGLISYFRR